MSCVYCATLESAMDDKDLPVIAQFVVRRRGYALSCRTHIGSSAALTPMLRKDNAEGRQE